nr:hypothetical protein [Tanacetum cinerariifolium]
MTPLGLIVSQGIQSILLSRWPKCFLGNIFHLQWSQSSEMQSPIFVNVPMNHYLRHGNVISFLLIDVLTRYTINVAARGTFMKRHPEECYDLIENMTAYHNDWDTSAQRSESSSSITSSFDTEIAALKAEIAEINKNLIRVLQVNQQVKAVTSNRETCGGLYSFSDCPATVGNTQNVYATGTYQAYQAPAYQAPIYQAMVQQPQIPQPQVVTTNEFNNFMKSNVRPSRLRTQCILLTTKALKTSNLRNLFLPLDNPELTIRRRSHFDPTLLNNSEMAAKGNGDLPVPDL